MDISKLKDKLGDETFAELQAFVAEKDSKIAEARTESIEGRKKLKKDLEDAQKLAAKAMEKLGVDSAEELEALPAGKGQGDEVKQLQTKLTKAERERDDFKKAAEEIGGKHRASLQRAAVADALSGHEFVARDLVETYVGGRLQWEGEELLAKADDGKLISVKDFVASVAKTRPELLKPAGTGGPGVRTPTAGSGGKDSSNLSPVARINAARGVTAE